MADSVLPYMVGGQTLLFRFKDMSDGTKALVVYTGGSSGGGGLGNATYVEKVVTDIASVVVAANPSRKSLLIVNNSAVDEVYLNTGTPVANGGSLKLKGGSQYSTDSTGNAFNAIAASGKTVSLTVEEIT